VSAAAARGFWRAPGRWLLAVGVGLVLAFAAIAWVQVRQAALLNGAVRNEGDNLLWSFFQLETEYLGLRDQLREAVRYPEHIDADRLRQRYELFASRVPLVDPERARHGLDLGPRHARVVADLKTFFEQTDALLAEQSTAVLDTAALAPVLVRLDPLHGPIHDLALACNQILAEKVGARNQAAVDQIRLGIGLTIFQSLLTLAFAGLGVRQFNALKRRRAELETLATHLHDARLEAEAASQAKSNFLANMSHELRTPFNGMLGMLSLLEASPLDAEQTDHLRTARQSAQHLLDLLNDILDISKLESGRLEIAPHGLDLWRLIGDVEALSRMGAEGRNLGIVVTVAPEVPRWVLADGKRLKQILFNLMSNAIKFTEQGEVSLRVACDPAAVVGDGLLALRLTVRDTGIGMDEAMLGRLFQRFAQGDASTSRRYGGTGLGLEISRTLARLMGGDIEVRSTPGAGSSFTVSLPVPVAEAPEAAAVGTASRGHALPAQGLDLLVADDHPVNRKFMNLLLTRMGHRVRLAHDGAQAVAAVRERVPDLVFMDLHMPQLDGLQATRELRAMPLPAGAVPVVALTADAFSETRERVRAAGMDEFLAKPVQPEEIEAVLMRRFGARAEAAAEEDAGDVATLARETEPATDPAPIVAPASAPPAPRRRLRATDLAEALDMGAVGEVCLGVTLVGYQGVLRSFLGDSSGSIAALRTALEAADTAELKPRAHAVKGVAASLGLKALRALAQRIEAEGEGFDAAECAAAAAELQDKHATAVALCQRMGLA
jgi:two-component system, sensor histidine kinase